MLGILGLACLTTNLSPLRSSSNFVRYVIIMCIVTCGDSEGTISDESSQYKWVIRLALCKNPYNLVLFVFRIGDQGLLRFLLHEHEQLSGGQGGIPPTFWPNTALPSQETLPQPPSGMDLTPHSIFSMLKYTIFEQVKLWFYKLAAGVGSSQKNSKA